MKFLDRHFLCALAASGTVKFTSAEIDQAEAEMHQNGITLSSLERDCITVGLTTNHAGTQYFSAYAAGYWLCLLSTHDGGASYVFDNIELPKFLLHALGTQFEAEARQASLYFASRGRDDDEADFYSHLRLGMAAAGLIDTEKKSLHLTARSLAIMDAGGSQSGRVNAILARYDAMVADPSIAAEIAEIERVERALRD